jgi:hypothetical protein
MGGAEERDRRAKALVWWGAMMPHLKKPPEFREFIGGGPNRASRADIAACVAAWDRVDRALMANRKVRT